jgi:hypothetical protein
MVRVCLLRFCFVIAAVLVGISASAAPITWHWDGPVTGYSCATGFLPCAPFALESVVPLGTPVDVFVSFDPDVPPANPSLPCLKGQASMSLQVLGRTYTTQGFVWEDAQGFGPGVCVPDYGNVEFVAPVWGYGGPALPDGWVPIQGNFLPGLYWSGDLASGQPASIFSQFPAFELPRQAPEQRFVVANLQAVPEPSTWLLLGSALSAAAAARRGFKRQSLD